MMAVESIPSRQDNEDKGGYRQINKSLNICAFDEFLNGQFAHLPQLPDVEQMTPRVLRILGQNPGKVNYVLWITIGRHP